MQVLRHCPKLSFPASFFDVDRPSLIMPMHGIQTMLDSVLRYINDKNDTGIQIVSYNVYNRKSYRFQVVASDYETVAVIQKPIIVQTNAKTVEMAFKLNQYIRDGIHKADPNDTFLIEAVGGYGSLINYRKTTFGTLPILDPIFVDPDLIGESTPMAVLSIPNPAQSHRLRTRV